MASTTGSAPPKKEPPTTTEFTNRDISGSYPPPPQTNGNPGEAARSPYPSGPPPQPYPNVYPPAMGYPPVGHNQHGFPQPYPAGYPNGGYPNAGYPNGYPAAYQYPQPQPHVNAYYNNGQPYRSGSSGFFRGFILCSFMIFMGFFLSSLITYLILRPEYPNYKVNNFAVSYLNTTGSTLDANWDARITIENPNDKLKAFFSHFKVEIIWGETPLARTNYGSGFDIETNQNKVMDVKVSTNPHGELVVGHWTAHDIAKERNSGFVNFGMRIYMVNTFRSGSIWTRSFATMAVCPDLKVQFHGNSANGTLNNGGKAIDCQLYI